MACQSKTIQLYRTETEEQTEVLLACFIHELFEKCLNYSISIHYPVLLKKQSVFSSPWIALKQRMFETWRIIRVSRDAYHRDINVGLLK